MKLLVLIVLAGIFILWSPVIFGQCRIDSLSNEAAGTDFGVEVAADGDMNGDGYADIAVSAWPKVYVYSGMDLSLMHEFTYNSVRPQFIVFAGDVNNDGYDDLAVSGVDRIDVYSGQNGNLLLTLDSILTQIGIISGAGDVNNDGSDDVIAGTFGGDTIAVVFSGSTGERLYTITKDPGYSHLITWVDGLGDIDMDGYADFVVGDIGSNINDSGRVYIFSGRTGQRLNLLKPGPGSTQPMVFGAGAAGIGDINMDGYPDIAATGGYGKINVFSGLDGAVLIATSEYGYPAALGDINDDGHPDFAVANSILSGADGQRLMTAAGGESPSAGDINNDGYFELIGNNPDSQRYIIISHLADGDCDGLPNNVDPCTDTDNDGFGNPGFSHNSCAPDNCPAAYNPDQADRDADGIGDACDECYDLVLRLGNDTLVLHGTGIELDTGQFLANIPLDVKLFRQTPDCLPDDSITYLELEVNFDSTAMEFINCVSDGTAWNGDITWHFVGGGTGSLRINFSYGKLPMPTDFETIGYLMFRGICQPDSHVTSLTFSDRYNQTVLGPRVGMRKPTELINGSITAIMGNTPCYTCGDADFDSKVNLLDVIYLISAFYKSGPPIYIQNAADVDSSGQADILDITYMINALYKGGPAVHCN